MHQSHFRPNKPHHDIHDHHHDHHYDSNNDRHHYDSNDDPTLKVLPSLRKSSDQLAVDSPDGKTETKVLISIDENNIYDDDDEIIFMRTNSFPRKPRLEESPSVLPNFPHLLLHRGNRHHP